MIHRFRLSRTQADSRRLSADVSPARLHNHNIKRRQGEKKPHLPFHQADRPSSVDSSCQVPRFSSADNPETEEGRISFSPPTAETCSSSARPPIGSSKRHAFAARLPSFSASRQRLVLLLFAFFANFTNRLTTADFSLSLSLLYRSLPLKELPEIGA